MQARAHHRDGMRAAGKVGLVAAGYVGAFLVASAIVALYVASTSGPDRQTYGAMYDFGDLLLFLAVFAAAAVLPTGAALFFLRSNRAFWRTLSVGALVVAATAVGAFIVYVAARAAGASAMLHAWSGLAGLRILVAPLFALAFFLATLLAPNPSSRIALFVATLIEAAVFAYVALVWFHPGR
jgi:hypothetical protein